MRLTSYCGKRFRVLPTSRWYTVVGVVGGTRDSSLTKLPAPVVYFPQTEYTDPAQRQTARTMALVIRTQGDPSSLNHEVQGIVRALDPSLPLFDVRPMVTGRSCRSATRGRLAGTLPAPPRTHRVLTVRRRGHGYWTLQLTNARKAPQRQAPAIKRAEASR